MEEEDEVGIILDNYLKEGGNADNFISLLVADNDERLNTISSKGSEDNFDLDQAYKFTDKSYKHLVKNHGVAFADSWKQKIEDAKRMHKELPDYADTVGDIASISPYFRTPMLEKLGYTQFRSPGLMEQDEFQVGVWAFGTQKPFHYLSPTELMEINGKTLQLDAHLGEPLIRDIDQEELSFRSIYDWAYEDKFAKDRTKSEKQFIGATNADIARFADLAEEKIAYLEKKLSSPVTTKEDIEPAEYRKQLLEQIDVLKTQKALGEEMKDRIATKKVKANGTYRDKNGRMYYKIREPNEDTSQRIVRRVYGPNPAFQAGYGSELYQSVHDSLLGLVGGAGTAVYMGGRTIDYINRLTAWMGPDSDVANLHNNAFRTALENGYNNFSYSVNSDMSVTSWEDQQAWDSSFTNLSKAVTNLVVQSLTLQGTGKLVQAGAKGLLKLTASKGSQLTGRALDMALNKAATNIGRNYTIGGYMSVAAHGALEEARRLGVGEHGQFVMAALAAATIPISEKMLGSPGTFLFRDKTSNPLSQWGQRLVANMNAIAKKTGVPLAKKFNTLQAVKPILTKTDKWFVKNWGKFTDWMSRSSQYTNTWARGATNIFKTGFQEALQENLEEKMMESAKLGYNILNEPKYKNLFHNIGAEMWSTGLLSFIGAGVSRAPFAFQKPSRNQIAVENLQGGSADIFRAAILAGQEELMLQELELMREMGKFSPDKKENEYIYNNYKSQLEFEKKLMNIAEAKGIKFDEFESMRQAFLEEAKSHIEASSLQTPTAGLSLYFAERDAKLRSMENQQKNALILAIAKSIDSSLNDVEAINNFTEDFQYVTFLDKEGEVIKTDIDSKKVALTRALEKYTELTGKDKASKLSEKINELIELKRQATEKWLGRFLEKTDQIADVKEQIETLESEIDAELAGFTSIKEFKKNFKELILLQNYLSPENKELRRKDILLQILTEHYKNTLDIPNQLSYSDIQANHAVYELYQEYISKNKPSDKGEDNYNKLAGVKEAIAQILAAGEAATVNDRLALVLTPEQVQEIRVELSKIPKIVEGATNLHVAEAINVLEELMENSPNLVQLVDGDYREFGKSGPTSIKSTFLNFYAGEGKDRKKVDIPAMLSRFSVDTRESYPDWIYNLSSEHVPSYDVRGYIKNENQKAADDLEYDKKDELVAVLGIVNYKLSLTTIFNHLNGESFDIAELKKMASDLEALIEISEENRNKLSKFNGEVKEQYVQQAANAIDLIYEEISSEVDIPEAIMADHTFEGLKEQEIALSKALVELQGSKPELIDSLIEKLIKKDDVKKFYTSDGIDLNESDESLFQGLYLMYLLRNNIQTFYNDMKEFYEKADKELIAFPTVEQLLVQRHIWQWFHSKEDDMWDSIVQSKAIFIRGAGGAGKSTYLFRYLIEEAVKDPKVKVVYSAPKNQIDILKAPNGAQKVDLDTLFKSPEEYDLIIIDEATLLHPDKYNLQKLIHKAKGKVALLGDELQSSAVVQKTGQGDKLLPQVLSLGIEVTMPLTKLFRTNKIQSAELQKVVRRYNQKMSTAAIDPNALSQAEFQAIDEELTTAFSTMQLSMYTGKEGGITTKKGIEQLTSDDEVIKKFKEHLASKKDRETVKLLVPSFFKHNITSFITGKMTTTKEIRKFLSEKYGIDEKDMISVRQAQGSSIDHVYMIGGSFTISPDVPANMQNKIKRGSFAGMLQMYVGISREIQSLTFSTPATLQANNIEAAEPADVKSYPSFKDKGKLRPVYVQLNVELNETLSKMYDMSEAKKTSEESKTERDQKKEETSNNKKEQKTAVKNEATKESMEKAAATAKNIVNKMSSMSADDINKLRDSARTITADSLLNKLNCK